MEGTQKFINKRGGSFNPDNRFDAISIRYDDEWDPSQDPLPKTQFFHDHTKTFINFNDSPDISIKAGINPYRGCEHGCVYCFARPNHEYLSLSSGLDFESKIFVKENAPALLRAELSKKSWEPQVVALSGSTDCYQPAERRFKITRECLKVFAEFRNPVAIITKNRLIERDIDVLTELNKYQSIAVYISVTTLDNELSGKMEPRASRPMDRLHAVKALSDAGIPVGVMVAPVVPGLTDIEIPQILEAAADAGARSASYLILRLPYAVKDLFVQWISDCYPEKKDKVLNRIRHIRGGKLNDPNFKTRMRGEGIFADHIRSMFHVYRRKYGLNQSGAGLSVEYFKRPGGVQMDFFDQGFA